MALSVPKPTSLPASPVAPGSPRCGGSEPQFRVACPASSPRRVSWTQCPSHDDAGRSQHAASLPPAPGPCEARCSLWVIYRIIYRLCSCRWLSGDIQTLQMGARTGQRERRVGMRTPTVGLRGACADAGAAGQIQAGRPGGAGRRSDFGPRWLRGLRGERV